YSLGKFDGIADAHGLLVAYQESEMAQDVASQIIFGGMGAKGKLPVTVSADFKIGDGLHTQGGVRLAYTEPEGVGIQSADLQKISSLVKRAMDEKAIPGAQVLLAKDGKIFYQESFGHHTYQGQIPVQ